MWYEYGKIAKRAFINYKRNPMLSVAKLAQAIFTIILLSAIWWKIGVLPKMEVGKTKQDYFQEL